MTLSQLETQQMDAPLLYHWRAPSLWQCGFKGVIIWLSASCSISSQSRHIAAVSNQTLRLCETTKCIFGTFCCCLLINVLIPPPHQQITPTERHRASDESHTAWADSDGCVRVCVMHKSFASFHVCMCCNPRRVLLRALMAADIRNTAVFFPFLQAQTISSQFEFLHLGALAQHFAAKFPLNNTAEQIRYGELNEQELPLTFLCSSWHWVKSSLSYRELTSGEIYLALVWDSCWITASCCVNKWKIKGALKSSIKYENHNMDIFFPTPSSFWRDYSPSSSYYDIKVKSAPIPHPHYLLSAMISHRHIISANNTSQRLYPKIIPTY